MTPNQTTPPTGQGPPRNPQDRHWGVPFETVRGQEQPSDRVTFERRRTLAVATLAVTTALTGLLWLLTALEGDQSLWVNYLVPMGAQLATLFVLSRFGVTPAVFVFLAAFLDVGLLCTLFLPGAHGMHALILFCGVPLLYVLGGARRGRLSSLFFVGLTATLFWGKWAQWFDIPSLSGSGEYLVLTVGCIVLQFFIAEANEKEHQSRLQSVYDHQFREPTSRMPNRNALAIQKVGPGQSLVLIQFVNLTTEQGQDPAQRAFEVQGLGFTNDGLYWIAEGLFALIDPTEASTATLRHRWTERLKTPNLPGFHSRSTVRVVCVPAPIEGGTAAPLLAEAELLLTLSNNAPGLTSPPAPGIMDLCETLRTCFRDRKMTAVFQPIYDSQAGGIAFLEGLTRLNINGTQVSPEPYLGLIGALGLDRQLTEFILDEAVRVGLETDYSVSVNLTYRDLEDTLFLPNILNACTAFQNRRNRLILELTEHIAFADRQSLDRFISRVHDVGGLVFLDDFGMGYSNYASIVAARFDAIKVAGSMVLGAQASTELRVLLSGIVRFAQVSGIELVAEHISDETIYTMVGEVGVRYLQGYYLQKPILGSTVLAGEADFGHLSNQELAIVVNSRSSPIEAGGGQASFVPPSLCLKKTSSGGTLRKARRSPSRSSPPGRPEERPTRLPPAPKAEGGSGAAESG